MKVPVGLLLCFSSAVVGHGDFLIGQDKVVPSITNQYLDKEPHWGRAHATVLADEMMKNWKISPNYKVLTIAKFPEVAEKFSKQPEVLQELLTTKIAMWTHSANENDSKVFTLVERSQLDKIMASNRLEMSDLFDGSGVKKIGGLIGADLILVGKITADPREFVVNWRFVDVISGTIVRAGSTGFPRR